MSKNEGSPTDPQQAFSIDGLSDTVEIATDRWGIAHIRASGRDDLFFGQGYNAARQRLWQIDLWRKRGLGLLAADFGPGFLAQDHATRHFVYRGEMAAEWAAYAPDAREIAEAFVAGINAFVDRVLGGEEPLPLEFSLLGTHPSHWMAEDVVRVRTHCLARNAVSEIVRAHMVARSGAKADALRKFLEPPVSPSTAPDLDLGGIPLSVLGLYRLAVAPVTFSQERLGATMDEVWKWRKVSPLGEVVRAIDGEGSNNWAISGERTETGRPIMALDPHRVHTVPGLRYFVHLTMPGLDVIGASDPAAPGILMGHNGHSAFSVTIFGADQEDVYVYELNPQDPSAYRYGTGWESMSVVQERYDVKGQAPATLPIRFTRHGAVIHQDAGRRQAYAIRTVWSEPGSAPYMASLSVMRARSFADYRKALEGWGAPTINHLYADVTGTIGWQSVGKSPIRPNWEGLLPVPGDGRYEWQGFIAPEAMPWACNPAQGYLATANEMNLSEAWRNGNPAIGHEWIDGSRAERIHEVLSQRERHSFEQSCALQADCYSVPARRMLAVLSGLSCEGAAERARRHLLAWDCVLDANSSAGALFEVWVTSHLTPRLYEVCAAPEKVDPLLQAGDIQSVLAVMEQPRAWLAGDAEAARQAIAAETLAAAWADLAARFGADPDAWKWGDIHILAMRHDVSGAFPDRADALDIAPIRLGGSGSTVRCAIYRPEDFRVLVGPSVRMVLDIGAWDNCVFINLPGQSGDPASPQYRDMVQSWQECGYMPLTYTRDAVDRVTESRLVISPAAPQ